MRREKYFSFHATVWGPIAVQRVTVVLENICGVSYFFGTITVTCPKVKEVLPLHFSVNFP